MTQQKILAFLQGCDSQHPMEFGALLKKTGLQPDTLRMVLDQMQHSLPATINSCTLTKQGKSSAMYWPTGAVGNPLTFHQIGNRNRQRAIERNASNLRRESAAENFIPERRPK